MCTPISELVLEKDQIKMLKKIKHKKQIQAKTIDKYKTTEYKFLFYYHLIEHSSSRTHYCLSQKGLNYLNYHSRDDKRFYITTGIAVLALIVSIVSIIISILK